MVDQRALPSHAIAVIGMAGRFPGAETVAALWAALREGRDLISHFSDEELEDSFNAEERAQPNFVKARPILKDVDQFDAGFFGMLGREAALLDPQQRLMLEVAWEALEDGGVDPARYDGAIGVFAGATYNSYFLQHVMQERKDLENFTSTLQLGDYARFAGAMGDTLATRIAYKFDLRGPAMSVQSCCSTSLLAIAQACQSLLLYQSDMALAGGVSITFPQRRGYHYVEDGMASADGACRPFDADAAGTIFGHGAGVVLLKRLEDAVADGDRIYCVIRSSAVNNDGADKVGFTAPSVAGQAAVIMTTHMTADVDARSIGYIEAHGTATPMGDPIEIAGLTKAFEASTSERQFCALGSVKANLGHLDAAAGVVGLIKAALTLQHNEIPPLAHYKAPNPRIDFAATPFFVADTLQPYPPTNGPRRAGVSSFGVGGTNVHVLLEEAPSTSIAGGLAGNTQNDAGEAPAVHVLTISAKSENSVNAMKAALADHLEANPNVSLADTAFTLQTARRAFDRRVAIAARDRADAIQKLRAPAQIQKASDTPSSIIFMFPGQGAQYPGMTAGLYASEPLFSSLIDRGAEVLKPLLGIDIRDALYKQPDAGEDTHHPIRSTILAQPALFLTEYATARLLMSWGVRPTAMVGHSVGEFVAACISGVMKLDDALSLIAARGRLMQAQEPGAMLSIRLPEAEARPLLGDDVDLAAINGPNLVVAAGSFAAIEALEARLKQQNVTHRRLHTSHAFHSRMMDGALAPLLEEARKLNLNPPRICFASGLTGDWISDQDATDPATWARHCREPVRFADALAKACDGKRPLLIEVGAGKTLSTLAAQVVAKDKIAGIVNTLPDVSREPEDALAIREAVGRVWAVGATVNFAALRAETAKRVSLPTYRFDRQRHWIDAPVKAAPAQTEALPPSAAILAAPSPFLAQQTAPPAPLTAPVSMSSQMTPEEHKAALANDLVSLLEDLSGEAIAGQDPNTSFLELGFDSLFLGQVAQSIQSKFGVKLSFRQLLGDYPSVEAVSAHLAAVVPVPIAAAMTQAAAPMPVAMMQTPAMAAPNGDMTGLFQMQLAAMQSLFAQQLATLQGGEMPAQATAAAQATPVATAPKVEEEDNTPARFKMYRPGAATQKTETTIAQRAFIEDLVALLNKKTPTAKTMTQANRAVLADPRTAAGFRLEWKELVYPIVSDRSKGSRVWDIDGNEYVDVVNGYGQTAFGHAPEFVVEALHAQLDKGFAIGPQSPMAGSVAARIAKMIGMERVTFCNTGSEAVMAAMRVARAVSGKKKIVVFNNDYHGQFDEVLLRPGPRNRPPGAAPVAPGITQENVANMVVLTYDDPASLDWIAANTDDIAAVLVEPVQSRHPEIQPVEFLRSLRKITADKDVALIFDEVVTGFRAHPGGVQALWGIRADLATYGKVIGGGMPIGLLCGSPKYMDALDGGHWSYGDDSLPEVAPTFFAGTFVRHPLVLAAAQAVCTLLETEGPALQERMTAATTKLVDRINADLSRRGLATRANQFSSFFYFNIGAEDRLASLFYPLARSKGLNIQEGFPCYLTCAHSEADYKFIGDVFAQCLDELQNVGILPGNAAVAEAGATSVPARAPALHVVELAVAKGPGEAPLTEPQTEVWLAAQLGDMASASFNEGMTLTLDGTLNFDALKQALNDVIARHDALRASFNASGQTMVIAQSLPVDLDIVDVSAEADPEAMLKRLQKDDSALPFDLVGGPLFRAFLVKLGAEKHALVFSAHHIVCDGWSVNVVLDELSQAYVARMQGQIPEMAQPLSYAQYATDYAKNGADRAQSEAFWMAKYKDGAPELPELPYDRARPAVKTFNGSTFSGDIDAALYKSVKKAGAKQGCTLFATLFASMQVLIGRLSNQNDIVLAVPTAGQSLLEGQILVGHCVNFLPFRAPFDPAAPFSTHLANVKKEVLDAFEHQDYTFGTLVRKLALKRDLNRLPMTEIQFNLERIGAKLDLPGLKAKAAPNGKAASNFDMFWNIIESDEGLHIDVDYNTDIFDEATIGRWIDHFRALLGAVAADATQPIQNMPVLSLEDRAWLKETLNATSAAFPRDALVHDLVSAQAARAPDKIAASDGAHEVTYAQLEAGSNMIAARLQEIAPKNGSRIAIATDRTVSMLAALLGTLKAGHAYVPLDPTHPASRLAQIIEGAQISALICDDAASEALAPAGVPTLRLDQIAANDIAGQTPKRVVKSAEDAAYVIFTSGSTGAPKGVEVPHRAFVNFLASMAKAPGFTANDSLLSVTTISFDIAGLELFLPLIAGGKVSIASRDEVRGGFGLVERIAREKPTVVQATPSLWRMVLEAGFKPSPAVKMLCGGEPLPRDLADQLLANDAVLWNMYGPTETTIWSSCGIVKMGAPITIGEPIDNTQLHILDAGDQLAPIGVTGDLYIGGDGLANGYFNQPELTAKAFRGIALDGGPVQRLYKTGDIARRLADGSIQHLGRNDQQIKLRGFRIELEDIESVLRRAPGIAACATAVREVKGDKRLVAYIVPAAGAALSVQELTAFLAAQLPDYMVPSLWMSLDALPLTPNKKLDRKALPTPDPASTATAARNIVAPRTDLERTLAEIWGDVLSIDQIGIHDNLFTLGADSLHVFRIAARTMDRGIKLEAKHLLQKPTIAELAELVAAQERGEVETRSAPSLRDFRGGARRRQTT